MEIPPLDLELLVGTYRAGKTRALVHELLTFKKNNALEPVLVLVPSARYGRLFQEAINHALKEDGNTAGLFSVEVMPFYHACLEELKKRRGETKVIPEEIRPALMSRVLSEMKAADEINSLAAIADFHGTPSAVLELIDEFQRAGLSPDDLLARLSRSACQESRFLELAQLYKRYTQKMQSLSCFDQKSVAMLCREVLFKKAKREFGLLIIDGFDRVSHLQAQIFSALSRCAEKTLISFDYPETRITTIPASPCEPDALAQSDEDYAWKESSYRELISNLAPKIRSMPSAERAAIAVHCSSSLDRFCEMRELVREVKIALTERKRSPDDLLVVIRSYDAYAGAVEAAFQEAGINYFVDGSSAVLELAPWQFLKQLLGLGQNEFKRKLLIDLLRSPYMKLSDLSLSVKHVSILDRESYDCRVVGGISDWKNFLKRESLAPFSDSILTLLAELDLQERYGTAEEHARVVEDLIDKYMQFPGSENDLRSAQASNEREALKAVRRALKVMLIQEQILSAEKESFQQFLQRFVSLIENSNYPRPKPLQAAVTISSAELAANKRFAEVFVCGMVEGDFPRHRATKGFLSPEETKRWLSFDVDIRNARHEPGFERALFYSILERASERLYLSLPQFEMSSEELLPSFYLSEIQSKIELTIHRTAPYKTGLAKPFSAKDAISSTLWHSDFRKLSKMLEGDSEELQVVRNGWMPLQNALQSVLARSNRESSNPYNGYLSDFFECNALTLPKIESWNASKLNDYGKCPFRFWTSHILNFTPREEPQRGLTAALIGMTYHKILELFFTAWGRAGREERSERGYILLDNAFDEGIKWLEARVDFSAGPYFEQEKKELRFRVNRFVQKELQRIANDPDSFVPSMFEVSFGRAKSQYPALELEGESGEKILLSGSIDRVDLIEGRLDTARGQVLGKAESASIPDFFPSTEKKIIAKLIDYKTGSRTIGIKEAEQGRNLQLPIYAMALSKSILPGCSVDSASYLSIGAARSVGQINFNAPEHSHIADRVEFLIKTQISEIGKGVFHVKPNGRDVCKACPHTSACRIVELKAVMEESSDAEAN